MKRIVFYAEAARDISTIRDFFGRESKQAALHVTKGIVTAIAQLGVFPRSGRHGKVRGTHELVIRSLPYVVVYIVSRNCVEIVAIVHTARQRPRRTIR